MSPVFSTDQIAEWAAQLEGWAAELRQKIPEIKALGGKVKIPGKTFARLGGEAQRLIGAIEMEAIRTRRRRLYLAPVGKRKSTKNGGAPK
jgi:hypothetical protein